MKKHTFDYDLIVIGTGVGGSVAATIAAREGWRVAVVERGVFGGDSSNTGDIPIGALLHAAHLYNEAKQGGEFGIRSTTLGYNYPSIRAWKESAMKRTGVADDRSFYTKQGIATFQGNAHFLTPHEITVNRRHLSAKFFLVATGTDWKIPTIQGLTDTAFYTPDTILDTLRPPKSLLVIGSGRRALEIAQAMAIFGTTVTVIESKSHVLPLFDKEVGNAVAQTLEQQMTILTDTTAVAITAQGREKRVTLSRGGATKYVTVDDILIADTTTPNIDIGLDNALVRYTTKGIETGRSFQTSTKHIYAVGDVLGNDRDSHATVIESRIAIHRILGGPLARPDYEAMPRVVTTNPGVAQVGLTVRDARRQKIAIKQATVPLKLVGASTIKGTNSGFVTIIVNERGVVVGGTIVAPQATELVQVLSVAIKHRLTASQLADTPYVFLSWSEAVRVAAQKLSKSAIV